jgi:drug/metabolite transporter (DMT)-like permease
VGGVTPALITSFMALRLISALVLGWLILGEQLVSPTQWLGAALVVGTVTVYLWLQKSSN